MYVTSAARQPAHTVRGTQRLVHILGACWRKPGVLARELAWRWLFGIPALLVIYLASRPLIATLLGSRSSLESVSVQDSNAGIETIATLAATVSPQVAHLALWLAPLLAIAWAIASGVGRSFVMRALAPQAQPAPVTLILLQALRIFMLGGSFLLWFRGIQWAAHATLYSGEPNLVGYFALVICLSLGMFTLWALLSWVFAIAPLLALLERRGIGSSLVVSLRLGPLTGKLVEVNLVLGIVKLALVVLAMVFSATPLPFESVVTGDALYVWWLVVSILYLVASDFFQVARLAAFVEFWRAYRGHIA